MGRTIRIVESCNHLRGVMNMSTSFLGDLNHEDRSRRVQLALDQATPLRALLDLAMEFPEAVAANPSLRAGIAVDPASVSGASAVSIACLLTSPATDAALAETLESAVALHWEADKVADLRSFLKEWRRSGARRLSVDHLHPRPSTVGLDTAVERVTRGQALLAQRLGWSSAWCRTFRDDRRPLIRYVGEAGQERDSSIRLLVPGWEVATYGSECEWKARFGADAEARVSMDFEPFDAVAQFMISVARPSSGSIFLVDSEDCDDASPLLPSQGAVAAVELAVRPLREIAERLPRGRCLFAGRWGQHVGVASTDVQAILEAASQAADGDFFDELEDGGSVDLPATVEDLFGTFLPASIWDAFRFDDFASAICDDDRSETWPAEANDLLALLDRVELQVLPRAGEDSPGVVPGDMDFRAVFIEPGGAIGLVFGTFCWCDRRWERLVSLDLVVDGG